MQKVLYLCVIHQEAKQDRNRAQVKPTDSLLQKQLRYRPKSVMVKQQVI